MDENTEKLAVEKAAAEEKAEADRRDAQAREQAKAQAAQQAAEMQREVAARQNAEAAAKAQAERDDSREFGNFPDVTGAGEVHAALRGYNGVLPLPPPLVQPALQRDHETLVAHMKAWVRREVALATVHGMDQSAREIHNP